jgi:hypothetical protein
LIAWSKVARDRCATAREYRNRHLAHRDLGLALGTSQQPLPRVDKSTTEESLASIRAILSALDPTVHWGAPLVRDDAEALIHYLESGVAYVEERRRARLSYRS